MRVTVKDIVHPITQDVDVTQSIGVGEVDALVFRCIVAAKDALQTLPPTGFSEYERDHLVAVIEGLRQSHLAIRKLLSGDQGGWGVDALAIARLQLEMVYTLCFLLQRPDNLRLFLKNSWKKKYIRFLLQREEHRSLPRFDDYYLRQGLTTLNALQRKSFVTDDERITIELDELGAASGRSPQPIRIATFPTPRGIIDQILNPTQVKLLKRLYPEYQFLCSFAHGDAEAAAFRAISDTRSPVRHFFTDEQRQDFYQRQVCEMPVTYSVISSVQVATEIAALYPGALKLLVEVSEAWTLLLKFTLLAAPLWEIRAKAVLPLISTP